MFSFKKSLRSAKQKAEAKNTTACLLQKKLFCKTTRYSTKI